MFRRLSLWAPGAPALHSTRRRAGIELWVPIPISPRRGGPLCPPEHTNTEMGFVDVHTSLAGWMHRVCADLAGCYEIPV